ncbi:MAG: prepilin peptidase [Bacillales bacterium]|jgi:leader peptidase (prepilin peptidase)/N-methyltransferase|nr:prepilin peptidase [Bacillales bacterium]
MLFINIIVVIISFILAVGYKNFYYKNDFKIVFKNPIQLIRENALALAIFIGNALGVSLLQLNGNLSYFLSFEYLILIYTICIISEIDIKDRIIPNQLVLFLFITRLILLWYSNLQMDVFINFMNFSPLIGFLIGSGVLLVSKILSKSGIGYGDVKLFAMIGFFVGEAGIISVLFYTFLLISLVGCGLLFSKKLSIRDTLPLAPFAFLGLQIYFPLTYINW